MFDDSKYKLGDLVMYNNELYRVRTVRRIIKSIPYTLFDYEYDLKLIREPREGELSVIRGVREYAISRKGEVDDKRKEHSMYYQNHRWDPKIMENKYYSVKSSLKALEELNRREVERIEAEPIRFKQLLSKEEINAMFGVPKFEYKKIIFNGPCTIILWKDGTKTIAKASDGEMFDPEKGVAICFMKRALGETEGKKVLRKANKDYYDEITKRAEKDLKEALTPMDDYLGGKVIFDDMAAFLSNSKFDNNAVVNIDQSTIDEVKKVEEEQQDNNLAIGSRCSTCKYYDRPMTADPCSYCISDDQYKKREETKNDKA